MRPAGASKLALVLGVNGQDGSYLAERLLQCGWHVTGVGRQAHSRWVCAASPRFTYQRLDLADDRQLSSLLLKVKPAAIFHFAAVHGAAGFDYEAHWRDVHAVNTLSAHAVLEYLRCHAPNSIFVYASSSKVYRTSEGGVFCESSRRESTCIYSTTKNAATDLIAYYRKQHHMKASVVWTFNHESPRRGNSYFMPKVISNLASAILDHGHVGTISSLSFWCDWGDARDFMAATVRIVELTPGQDYVLASGTTLWAEDFVTTLYARFGVSCQKHLQVKYLSEGPKPAAYSADISLLQQRIGATMRSAFEIAEDILRTNHAEAWAKVQPFLNP